MISRQLIFILIGLFYTLRDCRHPIPVSVPHAGHNAGFSAGNKFVHFLPWRFRSVKTREGITPITEARRFVLGYDSHLRKFFLWELDLCLTAKIYFVCLPVIVDIL